MADRYGHITQMTINVSKLLSNSTFGFLKEKLKTAWIQEISIKLQKPDKLKADL